MRPDVALQQFCIVDSIGSSSFVGDILMSSWTLRRTSKGEYQMDYVPAPRITEADKNNDMKALDKKLYLLIYGKPFGATSDKPVWHFPEQVYDSEPTLRKCAESALKSVLGDLTHTYLLEMLEWLTWLYNLRKNRLICHLTRDSSSNAVLLQRRSTT